MGAVCKGKYPSRVTALPETNLAVACPHCRQRLSLESGMANRSIRCPNCEKPFLFVPGTPDLELSPFQRGIVGLALFLLGSLSPMVMLVAIAVTLTLGPFALVIGPVAGLIIAIMLCGYVRLRAGPRWFWFYVGTGLAFSILVQFWSGQDYRGSNDGGSAFVLAQASAAAKILHHAITVLWLLGAAYVWFRKRGWPN